MRVVPSFEELAGRVSLRIKDPSPRRVHAAVEATEPRRIILTALVLIAVALASVVGVQRHHAAPSGAGTSSGGVRSGPVQSGIEPQAHRAEYAVTSESAHWGVTGQVQDVARRPIANALVCTADSPQSCCSPTRCAHTDPRGRFVFSGRGQEPSHLSASAPGHAGYFGPLKMAEPAVASAGGATKELIITLEAASQDRVTGQVVDASGGPVSEAMVTAFKDGGDGAMLAATQSSPSGSFELALPPGSVRLFARAIAYSEAARNVTSPADHVVLVLAPGSTLAGRVLARDDRTPIADALVTATPDSGLDIPLQGVRSGRDGNFRIEGLPASNYQLSAVHEHWHGSGLWVSLGVGERREDLVLEVIRGGSLRARLRVGGRPCSQGEVLLEGAASSIALSDEQGALEILGIAPGNYRARVQCNGATPLLEEGLVVGTETVSRTWDLELGLLLTGRALRANGEPLARAPISVAPVTAAVTGSAMTASTRVPTGSVQQCTSDETGNFSCGGLAPGAYDCRIMGPRGPRGDVVRISLLPGQASSVTLKAAGEAAIRVVWEKDSVPPPSAPILAEALDRHETWVATRVASTALFDALPLGRYAVQVGSKDTGQARQVHLARDGETAEVRLPAGSAQRITGRLLDDNGEGIPDAWVTAIPNVDAIGSFQESTQPVLSDRSGTFEVGPLARGDYRIEASAPSGRATLERVSAGASDVLLRIASHGEVLGHVLAPMGSPASRFSVEYTNARGEGARISGSDGTFRLPRLAPERYHLEILTPEGWVASADVQVAPNQEARVNLTLHESPSQDSERDSTGADPSSVQVASDGAAEDSAN